MKFHGYSETIVFGIYINFTYDKQLLAGAFQNKCS